MRILAIECSGADGSVALVQDGRVVGEEQFACPRGRGGGLFPALSRIVLQGTNLDLVLVGTGPGSYNGLRSSIAAAWGVSKARGVRLAGVCSLLGFDARDYYVVGDARAGEWFFARVTGGKLVSGPELLAPEVVRTLIEKGVPVFSGRDPGGIEGVEICCPRAEILVRHAAEAGNAEPIYLKPPHITKKIARQNFN